MKFYEDNKSTRALTTVLALVAGLGVIVLAIVK